MPSRSILPDTGVFVVKDGQWVESVDPQVGVNGVWGEAFEVDVQRAGAWETAYLRPIPVTIAITSDPVTDKVAGIDDLTGTITGTVTDALGRPVQATLRVVQVWDTIPTQVGTITSDAAGAWSFSFDEGPATVDDIGEYVYEFIFDEDPPLTATSVASPSFRVNSASVALTITSQPSGNLEKGYDTFTVNGTALREDGSPAPGTIALFMPTDNQPDPGSPWTTVDIDESGNWTTGAQGPSGYFGQRRITLHYEPLAGGFEDPTTVYGNTLTFVPRKPSFSKGSVGETSIAMSCNDVKATGYQFYEGGTRRYSGGNRSYTRSGLSNYKTYYNWKVRSYGKSPGGSTYYSSFSSEHDARTGRPEKRDSGSKTVTISPSKTGSWRDVDAWAWLGDRVGQGTYGTYGSYRGVIDFGSNNGVRNALRNGLGGDKTKRQQNGTCTKAEVYLYKRPGSGTSGTVSVKFHRASSAVGGSVGGAVYMKAVTSTNSGAGKWYDIGTSLGQLLGDGDQNTSYSRSIQIRNDGTGPYAVFNGRSSGSSDCRLKLSWSWNYVTQTKQNGTWLN